MDSLPQAVLYRKGLKLPGGTGNPNAKAPTREQGDISGWSASSRRRMREFIMTHDAPEGWRTLAVDLTYPPLPFGTPEPAVSREDALAVFQAWTKRCERATLGVIWRLEIQTRKDCERSDLVGIPQPHYHCIMIAPAAVTEPFVIGLWLAVLGERGKVKGAKKHACRVKSCEDWEAARTRYLVDHATKRKVDQVAVGWGRHWGAFGRGLFVEDVGIPQQLEPREEVWLSRLMRRGMRRRIVDKRATGGIPWQSLELITLPIGCQVNYLGGKILVPGWDGSGFPSRNVRRRICRALGVAKSNIWALKLAHGRTQRGYRFGNGSAYLSAARCMSKRVSQETNTDQGEL